MVRLIKQAILSGILVGLGVIINTKADNRYMGAMLFSVALLVIIKNGLKLYTGKIGFIKKTPVKELAVMLLFNLAGIFAVTMPVIYCNSEIKAAIEKASVNKFSNSCLQLLVYGILCGMLMFIAVYSDHVVITVFCIMVFILSGYEHCIADFPYLVMNFSIVNLGKFACVVLGNSLGSILTWYLTE